MQQQPTDIIHRPYPRHVPYASAPTILPALAVPTLPGRCHHGVHTTPHAMSPLSSPYRASSWAQSSSGSPAPPLLSTLYPQADDPRACAAQDENSEVWATWMSRTYAGQPECLAHMQGNLNVSQPECLEGNLNVSHICTGTVVSPGPWTKLCTLCW